MNNVRLATDVVTLIILPEHGGDLHALTHTGTGVDVLFKPHWEPSGVAALGGDRNTWLADYRGGWQVLLPNGGDECERDGQGRYFVQGRASHRPRTTQGRYFVQGRASHRPRTTKKWGFHGEASTVPWTVESAEATCAVLSVRLNTAPLQVHRTVSLDGATVRLEETVTNVGSDDAEVMYVHHPAFGLPLISPEARLDTGARTILTDPENPGSAADPGTTSAWPQLPNGTDLREIPAEPRTLMSFLTEFADPYYAITNPALGLGVGVRWNADLFPHAWLWQEFRHTTIQPWEGRATAMAVEPATTFPGYGLNYVNEHGGTGLIIPAGEHVDATLEMTLFTPPGDFSEVTGVDWGGRVTCRSD